MAYQANIPTGSVPLNQDYLNIQGNFSSLNSQFLVDHVPLISTSGTPPNGYHTALHLVPQSPDPTPVFGYGELYCKTNNDGKDTTQQLYYQFRNSTDTTTINVPLTRNFQPLVAATGYTFLPGGLIMQWGTISVSVGAGVGNQVNYPISFAAAAYSIQITNLQTSATATPGVEATTPAPSASGFRVRSGANVTVYWLAIGS